MTTPVNHHRIERFIHEAFHEIAQDKELKGVIIDFVSIIIERWEDFKETYLEK